MHHMQVEAGGEDEGASGYSHLKTDSRESGSKVTGYFAYKLGPSFLQTRVRDEGGYYAQ